MKRGDGIQALGVRDGRKMWRARLYWVDDRTGKAREHRVTFAADSRPLARLERDRRLEAARKGAAVAAERVTFARVAAEWFATVEKPRFAHLVGLARAPAQRAIRAVARRHDHSARAPGAKTGDNDGPK